MNFDETGKLYGYWKTNKDTYVITNRFKNFMYLLIGKDKAMLIDTGCAEGNLRAIIEEITDKEVIVVNTHGHFDHTGGNGEWEEVWMSEDSASLADSTYSEEQEKWRLEKPYLNYKKRSLTDGMTFDLGERIIEVISIGCHAKGSMALLDKTNKILYSGDELESGQVLLFSDSTKMSYKELAKLHKSNMEKLKSRIDEFDYICPAHSGVFLSPSDYINDYITLSTLILEDNYTVKEHNGGFGFPPIPNDNPSGFFRTEYGLASFVCQKDITGIY